MKSIISCIHIFLISLSIALISACDDDEVPPNETGTLTLEFDNRAGEDNLALNTTYTNESGEEFSLTTLNYYISNIRLKTLDGKEHTIPQDSSYFLIREDDEPSQEITLKNIPAGNYHEITFIIGVDSLKSAKEDGYRGGALDTDVHEDMYWSENDGYIFFKMEGTSASAPTPDNEFYYHIGGYGGKSVTTVNNIREKTIHMGSARAEVRANKSPKVHLHIDVLEFFGNPVNISIEEHPTVELSDYSRTVSENYTSMFRFDHVHN